MNHEGLLNKIYGAVADPQRWPEALANVSDHVGSIGGMLLYNAPQGGKHLIVLARLNPDLVDIFHKHHVWNQWALAMKDQAFDQVVIMGSLVEHRIIEKTGFYADVLAPQRIEDTLNISHRGMARDGGNGGFGFSLSARGAERAEQARRRLQRLTPHLCRALDATLHLGPLMDGSRQLTRVLQLMPSAAVLLDSRQRIVHANPAAEMLLRNGDGLTCSSNGGLRLSAVLPDESVALARTLAEALRVADGGDDVLGEPLRLTRPSGAAPLLVVPVPLPRPAFPFWELSGIARLLVLIIDPNNRNLAAATALQTTFGLTAAEARVATLVASGLTGPQTAEVLGVSPATIKTHLARCFAKIGIRSQVELARIIASLPVNSSPKGIS
jgi:DNA-binding CsgD family transcriptional regulator